MKTGIKAITKGNEFLWLMTIYGPPGIGLIPDIGYRVSALTVAGAMSVESSKCLINIKVISIVIPSIQFR
jgi:hypothetical protein